MTPDQNKYSLLPKRTVSFSFFILFFCFLSNSNTLFGQNVDNLHIEKVQEDGLSNIYINCIQQDGNGFLWFGTVEGLFRYDGYNYKPFRNLPGDTTALVNNAITVLFPEKKKLWIGSLGGLSCIDINTQIVKNYTAKEFLQVYTILPKNDSVFWVGTSTGLFQFNKNNSQWKRVPVIGKNVFINSMCDDKRNHLYLTTSNGFYCYTILTGASKYYRPDLPRYPHSAATVPLSFFCATSDHEGNIWMGTWDAGLVRFNPKTEEIKAWSHQTGDAHLPYNIVTGLLPDNIGNIWIANKEGGLTIFNPSKNKFTNYPVEWGSETKISGSVKVLFRDRSGTVWIGTENGIYKYDPCRFFLSRTDMLLKTDSGLQQTHISPITMLKDRDGLWWMGMYEGLFIFDKKTGVLQDYNKKFGIPANFPVFNIIHDLNGTIWLTAKNTLVKISKKTNHKSTSFREEIFKSADIKSAMYSLYIDKENRIWIGTSTEGIFRFDQASKKFISCNYQEKSIRHKIKEIRAFCELSKDSLLIGGEHTGLILLHTNTGRYEKISIDNVGSPGTDLTVNVIYKKQGSIWIGTEYSGLLQTNSHFKKPFVETTTNDGLPSMTISAIEGDQLDNLWLLTGAGVVEFHIPDKKITVFDKKDGIKNLDELYSIIGDDKGDISFGSRGGIYSFNPAAIIKNIQPPDVSITDLRIFDKEYIINKGETIKLNYNQNYFTFEYVALNYTQSKLNRYAYKMVGLDKKWNYAGPRRYVSYANLDEGTYTFNVKASNNEGVWNNVPAKLILIIAPPFWRQWWFYLIFALVVLSIMYVIYVYNMNQLRIRLQLRDKIARDLHDDIGSTLSGINIFSKIALQKIDTDRQSSRELLEKISNRSEKTLDALSDIVWSINTRNDGMDNFLRKAREYLAEVLEVQSILYDFNSDHDMENLKIGMATRKELYLIFKEAICNASKYAQCTFIQISLTKHRDVCTLTIQDNGRGFNINTVSSGNGIYNMKHRAEKMNGLFHIESEENKGTLITLSFRIPRFR